MAKPALEDPKGVLIAFRVPKEVAEAMDQAADAYSRETHVPLKRNQWARMKIMEEMDDAKRKRKGD